MDDLKTINVKLSCSYDRKFYQGDIVRSFEGMFYEIIGCGFSKYWGCEVMVYKRLTDDSLLVEPCRIFYDKVNKVKFPKAEQDYKFLRVVRYEDIK